MSRPIGILASTLSPDPRESIRLARQAEFDGVQLEINSPSLALQKLDRSGQRDLIQLVASHNLKLLSLTTTCGRAGFSPGADIDRLVEHLDRSLHTAADLACPVLCIDLGPLPPPPAEPIAAPPPIDPILAGALLIPTRQAAPPPAPVERRDLPFESQLDAGLTEVGRLADRYGVLLAFRSELAAFGSIHRALDAARCPFFSIDFDPVAVLRDTWPLETILSRFSGRIAHLRARDALRGSAGRTQPTPIGQGDTHFPDLLHQLDATHFSGPRVIDSTELRDRTSAAGAALEYLRSAMR